MGVWGRLRHDLMAHPAPSWAGFLSMDEYAEFRTLLAEELDRRELYAPHPERGLVQVWYVGNRAAHRRANLKEPVGELWLGDLARAYHRCEPEDRAAIVTDFIERSLTTS